MRALLLVFVLLAGPAFGQSAEFDAGDYEKARELYRLAVERDPLDVTAWSRLGLIGSWTERYDEAIEAWQRAIALSPEDPALPVGLARTLAWKGDLAAAEALYRDVLLAHPDDLPAALGLAQTISWSDRLPEAVASYEGILARHPDEPKAHRGLGQVRSWQGMDRDALEHLRRAAELAPDDAETRGLLRRLELAHRPTLEPLYRSSHDTDTNDLAVVGATVAFDLEPQTRVRASVRNDRATNRLQALGGQARTLQLGVRSRISPEVEVHAHGGAVQLSPDGGPASSQAMGGVGLFLSPTTADHVRVDYSHQVLTETAQLIGNSVSLDDVTLGYGRRLTPDDQVELSYGRSTFSDRNRRDALFGSYFHRFRVGPQVRLGVVHRELTYERRSSSGYFSPPRFHQTELVLALEHDDLDDPILYSLTAGAGFQKIDTERAQFLHRIALGLGYRLSDDVVLELGGETTNSATSSVTGFGYQAGWVRALIRF